VTPVRRLAALALLSAMLTPEAGAQVRSPAGTIDSLRPCAAAAAVLPGGAQVVRGRIRAEHFPAGRQTVIESLPDSARHALRGVRSLTFRTSTWHRGTEAKPSATLELRVAASARASESSRFILLLDGRSSDLGELRERPTVDSAGGELGVWSITAPVAASQFRALIRASRAGIAAGRLQTTLTAAEQEGARGVFVRAVCGNAAATF
jgi:hypothetical protein